MSDVEDVRVLSRLSKIEDTLDKEEKDKDKILEYLKKNIRPYEAEAVGSLGRSHSYLLVTIVGTDGKEYQCPYSYSYSSNYAYDSNYIEGESKPVLEFISELLAQGVVPKEVIVKRKVYDNWVGQEKVDTEEEYKTKFDKEMLEIVKQYLRKKLFSGENVAND